MRSLYLARRLRVLTDAARVCPTFTAHPRKLHTYCLRCGGDELTHVALLAAEMLDPLLPGSAEARPDPTGPGYPWNGVDVGAIDITNYQCVALCDRQIVILRPCACFQPLEALVHASWIVAIAEADAPASFAAVHARVQNT